MRRPITTLAALAASLVLAAVANAGTGGPGQLNAGQGCAAQCITTALVDPGMADASIRVESSVRATFTVAVSDQAPGAIDGVPWMPNPDAFRQTWIRTRSHRFQLDGLLAGTTYHVLVTATDANGRKATRVGTFRTDDPPPLPPAVQAERVAQVTFWKVVVLNDADKGANRGEISFDYYVADRWVHENGQRKLKTGASFVPQDRSAPFTVPVEGDTVDLRVRGIECDGAGKGGCPQEVGDVSCLSEGNTDRACARATVDPTAGPGALPPAYGTDMPYGHDAYVVFETQGTYLRFRVHAFVDLVPVS